MRPNDIRQTAHIDHGVSRETTMTISSDAADAAFVIQTMTDLYSNKRLAPIREISTNAWDSHLAAGQTRPIEVTLPKASDSTPTFTVQDWGVGMDSDDLENIYSKFGKSTKRTDGDATGMLGLGCKSPLTYTLSFTVVGVKDGVKTVGVVSKNEAGIGVIKTFPTTATDEPNGFTVQMPVKSEDVERFNADAQEFFSYWRDGVLVNGAEPVGKVADQGIEVLGETLVIDPDIAVVSGMNRGYQSRSYDSIVVQGNVAYPYTTPTNMPRTVTWVPMGSVDFVPSREALHMTPRTEETLKEIGDFIKATLDRVITERLAECVNRYEYMRTSLQIRSMLPYGYNHPQLKHVAYQELQIGHATDDSEDRRNNWRVARAWRVSGEVAEKIDSIREQWISADNHTYITGFEPRAVSARHKARIEEAGISEPYIVLRPGVYDTSGFPTRKWSSIPELPRKMVVREKATGERRSYNTATKYDIAIGGRSQALEQYEGDLPILWVENDTHLARTLSGLMDVAVASIIITQVDRFTRLHPKVQPWRDYTEAEIARTVKRLTKGDHAYLDAESWKRTIAQAFDKTVKDPALKEAASLKKSKHLEFLCKAERELGVHGVTYNPLTPGGDDSLLRRIRVSLQEAWSLQLPPELLNRYPLISNVRIHDLRRNRDDYITYVNAKYRAIKKAASAATDDAADAA